MDDPKTVCGTVAVGTAKKNGEGDVILERIVSATYDKCRADPACGLIPGFPDFGPVLAQMSEAQAGASDDSGYQVTVLTPAGALVVKEPFFEQFNELDAFTDLINEHNEKFNTDGVRLARETTTAPAEDRVDTCQLVESAEPLTAEKLAAMNLHKPQANSCLWNMRIIKIEVLKGITIKSYQIFSAQGLNWRSMLPSRCLWMTVAQPCTLSWKKAIKSIAIFS